MYTSALKSASENQLLTQLTTKNSPCHIPEYQVYSLPGSISHNSHPKKLYTAIVIRILKIIAINIFFCAPTPNPQIKKESVESISLSEWRFWNTYATNKQYPTPVLSEGQKLHPDYTIRSDECVALLVALKFSRFPFKDKS